MVKNYFLSFFFLSALAIGGPKTNAQAQTVIGMGTDQPNPNAVLELVPENGNQGFLAPRLTTSQRQASSFTGKLSSADHGLLVFDTNEGKFFYWFRGEWRAGTPGESTGADPGVAGTTWYTGNTAPGGLDAAEGDFYINESTGEVFKFSSNGFASMGSLKAAAGSTPNLSEVIQQGGSAGNQKISDLDDPTLARDAATKGYVDDRETAIKTYVDQEIIALPNITAPRLEDVLNRDDDASGNQILNLGIPTLANHTATKAYVDSEIINASLPGGSMPSLEQVLDENNSAANKQITNLAAPSAASHAANRKYVDDRDLENVLDRDNNAGGIQITNLGSPTAVDHATNRKYVDDQNETLKQYVIDESIITSISISGSNTLNINEGTTTHTIGLPSAGTPASLNEGDFFIGNGDDEPIPVTIKGHITIDGSGVATITDAIVTTAKIANGAVTKEKINADVAGLGIVKNTTDGSLEVNVGSGLAVTGNKVRITPFPDGWIGIGQGLGNDMNFKEVKGDATLNKDGEVTVRGLRGRRVANVAPSDKQVLQWDATANAGAGQWVPATIPGVGSGTPAVTTGTSSPSSGSGEAGDIYIMNGEDIYIKVNNSDWVFIKSK